MITRRGTLFGPAMLAFAATLPAITANAKTTNVDGLERVKIDLVAPPNVHPHQIVTKDDPKIFEFQLNIIEKEITLDKEGTKYRAMTYDGAIPGPMMIGHQDDYVEITLVNADSNEMPHNIDFHAATGALGGGALTMVNPGEQATLRFKATRPGVFIYHCAPEGMIPWHVVSGMSGVIMILPRDGLKDEAGQSLKYDKVFYIGENDFYVPRDKDGKYMSFESTGESFEDVTRTMRGLIPTHVVFNGKKGSLTGENALKAKVGETVLIVHCQANRDTRPHLIGGHGDHVWGAGQVQQSTLQRSGDLVCSGWICCGCTIHIPATRSLRLCQSQPD